MKTKVYNSIGRLVDTDKQVGDFKCPQYYTWRKKKGKIKDILPFSQILKDVKKLRSWTKPSKNVDAHIQDLH